MGYLTISTNVRRYQTHHRRQLIGRTLAVAGLLIRAAGQSSVDGAGGGLLAITARKLVGNDAVARSISRCRFLRRDGAPIRCAALQRHHIVNRENQYSTTLE